MSLEKYIKTLKIGSDVVVKDLDKYKTCKVVEVNEVGYIKAQVVVFQRDLVKLNESYEFFFDGKSKNYTINGLEFPNWKIFDFNLIDLTIPKEMNDFNNRKNKAKFERQMKAVSCSLVNKELSSFNQDNYENNSMILSEIQTLLKRWK